jgi:uncharacterized protein (TIGR02996 family)
MRASERARKNAAFLDSVLANPLEDVHRLVYADWLDEQDDPRAAFVRLAVALGDLDAGDPGLAASATTCRELQAQCDPWWAVRVMAPSQVRRLRRLAESRFGPLDALYTKTLYDSRCLHRPTTRKAVRAAERNLGFALPPLLGLVWTCIGNGGLLLSLLGLRGGQTGFQDIGFKHRDVVAGYHACVAYGKWRPEDDGFDPWPKGLVPIYDGAGCGMVDYVDCTTPEGVVLRADSGHLARTHDSLEAYFHETLTFWTVP